MENENKGKFRTERHDRFWTGLGLVVVGGFLLARKVGADIPAWVFSWPMILILIGLITGVKSRFRDNYSWLIMIGIGLVFLTDEAMIEWNIKRYFWPIVIIGAGLIFMLRPRKRWHREKQSQDNFGNQNLSLEDKPMAGSTEDVIESVSVFAGVQKVVTSKNFKGGEIVCIMGGAEYNLSQADISGPIEIEIVQVFGGTKLIVPPHWEIRSESVVAIFAGIEDKRAIQPGAFDPNKVLILKGTTIFGGIEIKSF